MLQKKWLLNHFILQKKLLSLVLPAVRPLSLIHPFYNPLQRFEMILKRLLPRLGDRIGRIRLSSDESLMHLDKPILLQVDQMRSQITIRQLQQLFQIIEADLLVDHKNAHNPHPNAAIEHLIQIADRILHTPTPLSYFHHMISP